ncbi:MAG: hypothetical protein P1U87_17670 [Verrucomicrobiales bacterium]|nr:hypothetical protein [Verrucomicrobiales bacterium]
MKKFSSFGKCLGGVFLLSVLAFTGCTSKGGNGGAAGSGVYSAPGVYSPADRTDAMRNEYRDWIRH